MTCLYTVPWRDFGKWLDPLQNPLGHGPAHGELVNTKRATLWRARLWNALMQSIESTNRRGPPSVQWPTTAAAAPAVLFVGHHACIHKTR